MVRWRILYRNENVPEVATTLFYRECGKSNSVP